MESVKYTDDKNIELQQQQGAGEGTGRPEGAI